MAETKVSFKTLLKEFGHERILYGTDLIVSVFLTVIITLFWCNSDIFILDKDLFNTLIDTSGTLFGLLFTAFSIFISVSDQKFISILRKANLLNKMIFPFWYVSILYLLSIILDFFVIMTFKPYDPTKCVENCGCNPIPPVDWLAIVAIFVTIYSLLATFYRIAATVKIGIYRSQDYKDS